MTTRAITEREYQQLIQYAPERVALALRVAWETGLRISDILALRRHDISRHMTVTERKTGHQRNIALSPGLVHDLRALPPSEGDISGLAIGCNRSTIYRHIRAIADGSHMGPGVSIHSVRKAYAKRYAAKHGLTATQRELGHRDKLTTLLYVSDIWAADQAQQRANPQT